MRIFKPQQLIFLQTPYQIEHHFFRGLSVVAGFSLSNPMHFLTESEVWDAWEKAKPSLPNLDLAIEKPFAEYVIIGDAFSGVEETHIDVDIEIGELKRAWQVRGNTLKKSGEVAPFLTLSMDHQNAFGGKNNRENPLGKGDEEDTYYANLIEKNVNEESHDLTSPFPIPPEFWIRQQYIAEIAEVMNSDKYMSTIYPGLPKELDHRYFQVASPKQWLNVSEWPQVIPYKLQGFFGNNQIKTGVCPEVVARVFMKQQADEKLQEVLLKKQTLCFLPNQDLALIIFTGKVEIDYIFDEKIQEIMIGIDHANNPRSEDHYLNVYEKRTDKDQETFESLYDLDLMPLNATFNIVQSFQSHPSFLNYEKQLTSQAEMDAYFSKILESKTVYADEKMKNEAKKKEKGPQEESPKVAQEKLVDFSEAVIKQKHFNQISEDFSNNIHQKTFEFCNFLDLCWDDMTIKNVIFENCHFKNCTFQQTVFDKTQFIHCQFSNSQLNDTYFTNVDIKGGQWIDSVYEKCLFNKSNINQVIIEGSNIHQTRFMESTITESMIKKSIFEKNIIVKSELSTLSFEKATSQDNEFHQTGLNKSSISKSTWIKNRWHYCQLAMVTVALESDFSQNHFSDCSLSKSCFMKMPMQESQFVFCAMKDVIFDDAKMSDVFVSRSDMSFSRFKSTILKNSIWQESSLQNSFFYGANLNGAEFQACNLVNANLAMVDRERTLFNNCLLEKISYLPEKNQEEMSK